MTYRLMDGRTLLQRGEDASNEWAGAGNGQQYPLPCCSHFWNLKYSWAKGIADHYWPEALGWGDCMDQYLFLLMYWWIEVFPCSTGHHPSFQSDAQKLISWHKPSKLLLPLTMLSICGCYALLSSIGDLLNCVRDPSHNSLRSAPL